MNGHYFESGDGRGYWVSQTSIDDFEDGTRAPGVSSKAIREDHNPQRCAELNGACVAAFLAGDAEGDGNEQRD